MQSTKKIAVKSKEYLETAPSLNGQTANIDCWLDAAGAEIFLMISYAAWEN